MKIIKIFSLLVLFTGFCLKIHAQAPQIISIDKTSGTVNETITINGSGFGSVAGNLLANQPERLVVPRDADRAIEGEVDGRCLDLLAGPASSCPGD